MEAAWAASASCRSFVYRNRDSLLFGRVVTTRTSLSNVLLSVVVRPTGTTLARKHGGACGECGEYGLHSKQVVEAVGQDDCGAKN